MVAKTINRILRDRDTLTFLVVDFVVGAIVTLLSWLTHEDKEMALLWAMGGTAFLWIMTIRVQLGLQRHDNAAGLARLQRGVEEAIALKISALRDPAMAGQLRMIVDGAAAVETSLKEPFRTFATNSLREFARKMASIDQGEVTVSSDVAWHWALDFLGKSQTVFATTFSSRRSFWSSQPGRQYMAENKSAVQRGASIVRVFILDGDDDEHLIEHIVKDHIQSGIGVWIVKSDSLEASKILDICVFDERLVSIWNSAQPGSELEYVSWSSADPAVETYQSIRSYYSYRAQKICSLEELSQWQNSLMRPPG